MPSTSSEGPRGRAGTGFSHVSPSTEAVRAQLERVLANQPFARSERLSRFLRFTVEQALQGNGSALKEYLLGVEVFDRGDSFDPRTDNIVRVEARRLRTSLIEYYATAGRHDGILIELPKGRYVPVFTEQTPPASTAKSSPARRARVKTWMAAALLLGIATYAVIHFTIRNRPLAIIPASVAVLPFVNHTGNPEMEFLCDGITEEIINGLAKVRELSVVARTSSFQFKGKSLDIREIGRRLNVSSLLEGSIRKLGDRLRITVQLIRVDDGYSLWSETYERDIQGTFQIQQEISRALVQKLRGHTPASPAQAAHSRNPEAWILYQKGRHFWFKWTPDGAQKSIEYFEQAIAKDPEYAVAYAALADAWGVLGHWGVVPQREASPKRDAALKKALELNGSLAEVRVPFAMKKAFYDWDWDGAEREFRSILETDPGSGEVFRSFAVVLQAMGRFEDARQFATRALELDPLSPLTNSTPGFLLFYQGQYDSAIEHCRRLLELDLNAAQAHALLGRSYERKSMYPQAIQSLEKARSLAPGNTEIAAALGYAYARSGDRHHTEQVLEDLKQLASRRRVSPVDFAVVHAGLGDKKTALDLLERGVQERDGRLVQLKVSPFYESLHSEPRYRNLLKQIGLDR
jgi:TolB-like protein/Flp pilus assembly protein TadD